MNHLDRQLKSSKMLPDRKSLVWKFIFKRCRSAARRANHLRMPAHSSIAYLAGETAILAIKAKSMLK